MLEKTPMINSYKMITILAMLAIDRFPGTISIKELVQEFTKIVKRSAALKADIGINYTDVPRVHNLLLRNPVAAWINETSFAYDSETFSCSVEIGQPERDDFQEMVREIVEWRLAEYLQRDTAGKGSGIEPPTKVENPEIWHPYMREYIPGLFGFDFNIAIWNVGFVSKDAHLFLLVTLENNGFTEDFKYEDGFISPDIIKWQSQNRTTKDSTIGERISKHKEKGIAVHLFVRRSKKIGQNAAPFYYCGNVDFIDWEGDAPITVKWQLSEPVPESLQATFNVI
jgi:hypothetical protein